MSGARRLAGLADAPLLTAVGLMSGTSADGVDAAVVRVRDDGGRLRAETLGGTTCPLPEALRRRVRGAARADAAELARLHAALGELFAHAALAAIRATGLVPADVDVIGSHGQTVAHLPGAGDGAGAGTETESRTGAATGTATLQIGCPARIAERTGILVVSDLRSRDTAAGGQGAPLVPHVDWLLLRRDDGARVVQNIGGVGNATLVTRDEADVRALDTGPGNGPLDAAAARLLGAPCDRDGAAAARGTPDEAEVARVLADPWFALPPPRTLARETYGDRLADELLGRRPDLSPEDALATLTEIVARTIEHALRVHLLPCAGADGGVRDVVVSGGGVHNATLMSRLRARLAPLPVLSSAELGVDPDLREAVAFAVLACETVRGRPGNLPAVTGAAGPRVLGSITLP